MTSNAPRALVPPTAGAHVPQNADLPISGE